MRPVNVLTLILAGGTGTRLRPLTLRRCKPAVPFGGDFRVIDFTLMSCVSSGVGAIYVLTQHRSEILESHFNGRWKSFSSARNSCATSLTTLSPKKGEAYVGTADAVYKNLELLKLRDAVLVLSGDHIYHPALPTRNPSCLESTFLRQVSAATYELMLIQRRVE